MALNYAVQQRLRMIDFLLEFYGSVGRAEIMDYFGIESATATRDLTEYRKIAPGNAALNQTNKRWVKTDTFMRIWA